MMQAVMTAPGTIEFRDVPAPRSGPGEVLLRIRRIGICGSDVHVWHGRHPYTKYPVIQGHEFSAVVADAGEGVRGIPIGAAATARPQVICGACRPCRRGDYHICDDLRVWGFQSPGCAQELFVAPADQVYILPESVSLDQGALVEPAAVAVHAVDRAGAPLAGRNVVVLGAGPIGNLVGQVAREHGANVLAVDLSDFRLDVARGCGMGWTSNAAAEPLADAVRRAFGGEGFDLAFECVGAESAAAAAIQSVQKGGTVVVVGVFGSPLPRIDLGLVQDRELNLRGTLMYRHPDYQQAIRMLAEGRISTQLLISQHFTFYQYADAYRAIDASGPRMMKAMIDL